MQISNETKNKKMKKKFISALGTFTAENKDGFTTIFNVYQYNLLCAKISVSYEEKPEFAFLDKDTYFSGNKLRELISLGDQISNVYRKFCKAE